MSEYLQAWRILLAEDEEGDQSMLCTAQPDPSQMDDDELRAVAVTTLKVLSERHGADFILENIQADVMNCTRHNLTDEDGNELGSADPPD